jgi:membrane fusion protein, multidrug efflux system
MAVKNGGNAPSHLRTLFNLGAIGSHSDGQLLERFATGCGEPRELAFAALVERHGPFVLRICRSVLRDEWAAEDAFQATFLALARKAGSLWTRDSLAPWLHQAAYRAAIHERTATIRRRSRENAAAALRPESVAATHYHDDLEKIIHEEIDRLPGRFRVAVVLCDLEGRTHEQAARHLGCAVGTVKSRLARGRKRLRGRLERRGAAPALALVAASAGGAARAAVPTGLARATVVHAATAGTVPISVAVINGGVLMSMILNKVKFVMAVTAVAAAVAAGAVALRSARIVGPAGQDRDAASLPGAKPSRPEDGQERHKVVITSPRAMDVTVTLRYACQINARRYINIQALVAGRLDEIHVKDGQAVKKGDLMFKIAPALARSKLEAEKAEADLAQREYDNAKRLPEIQGPKAPQNEVALAKDKLDKAKARRELAQAELNFANVAAPFDGIIGGPRVQPGDLIKEGDILATLSDNSVMWVFYKVSEKDYLDYMAGREQSEEYKPELVLADQTKYPQPGKFGAIEAQIHNETGDIAFRADFPNPDGLLRHGQAGTILIRRKLHDAIVVPARATFEILGKRYIYVVDKDLVVHRREIIVQNEMDDIDVIKKGVDVTDRIIPDWIGQVWDGAKVECEFRHPEGVMAGMHIRAE